MNFLADPGAVNHAAAGATTTTTEMSLEEALAFFDGYDDHTMQHRQQHTQQHMQQQQHQHMQQQQQQLNGVSNSHISVQLYQQQQQQLQHFTMPPTTTTAATTTTDMLMMIDDPVGTPNSSSDFRLSDASVNAFLFSASTPTSATAAAAAAVHNSSSTATTMLDASMSYSNADFGMMASLLQPLHLDDSAVVTALPTDNALAAPLTPETSPMQTLLAAPLVPATVSEPATSAETPLSTSTAAKTTRTVARSGRPQRIKSDPQPSAAIATANTVAVPTSNSNSAGLGPNRAASSTKRVRRQKEELLYLRAKVVEMEERLQQLKRVNGSDVGGSARGSPAPSASNDDLLDPDIVVSSSSKKRRSDESSGTDDDAASSTEAPSPTALSSSPPPAISPALLASVWENVAERQYKERLRAEQQNKKLKTMLEAQLKLATSLEKILKKRPNMEVLYPDTDDLKAPGATSRVVTYSDSDADVFAEQLAAVEAAFPRTDAVLAASGFFTDDDESTRHDFNVKDYPDANGVLMEFMATMTVPFDLDIAGNALWRFMSDVAVKKHCYFEEVIESTDDRVSRSFGVRVHENGKDVDLRGKHTLRKYVTPTRVVVVWASLMEPRELAGAPVTGLRFRDIGWLVAERAVTQTGATLIKAFGNLSPLVPADNDDDAAAVGGDDDARIGVLTDFVIHSHESNAALCRQLINDLLVEEEWKATLPVAL